MDNTNQVQRRYCWSSDEEEFFGEFATREEAAAVCDARFTAEIVPAAELLAVSPLHIESLIEDISDDLVEHVGGDEAAIELTAKDAATLAEIVRVFLVGHARFNRHGVKNVRRVRKEDANHVL